MDITSLIDHKKAKGAVGIATEWGSSFHIKCDGVEVLFDAGSSGQCVDNAAILGIDIRGVSLAVLSHGHYDHGGGLQRFLQANQQAKVYMARGADAGFYARLFGLKHFVGLDNTLFQQFARRIEFLARTTQLAKGVHAILPLENLHQAPRGNRFLFRRDAAGLVRDDFNHELALAIESADEMVVFSGCSHHGIQNVWAAASRDLSQRRIRAVFGGFHLVNVPLPFSLAESKASVRALGQMLAQSGTDLFYTCHCTGARGYKLLRQAAGDTVKYFPAGARAHI